MLVKTVVVVKAVVIAVIGCDDRGTSGTTRLDPPFYTVTLSLSLSKTTVLRIVTFILFLK